jgi:O-antigen/teichoic acid export membrane protein
MATYGREVLVALTTQQYAPAHTAIPWLVGAQVLLGAASITNAGTLASGKTGANSVAAAIAAVIGISLSLALVPRFGLDGAAAGAFLAALTFAAVLPVLSRQSVDIRFDAASASLLLAIYVAASAGILTLHRVEGSGSLGSRTATLLAALAAMGIAAYVSARRDRGARQAPASSPGRAQVG